MCTVQDELEQLRKLKSVCLRALDQEFDDVCWLDLYREIGECLGREFKPRLLPRERFDANCRRYADSLYRGESYAQDAISEALKEARAIREQTQKEQEEQALAVAAWEASYGTLGWDGETKLYKRLLSLLAALAVLPPHAGNFRRVGDG